MTDMIYANDLKQAMKDAGTFDCVKEEVVYKSAWGVPIVDAEEVVRCKECKYYDEEYSACTIAVKGPTLIDDYYSNYIQQIQIYTGGL